MTVRSTLAAFAICAAGFSATAQSVTAPQVASASRPVFLDTAPGDDDRIFVVEQAGRIVIYTEGSGISPTPFLDIVGPVIGGTSGGDERGLLGLAFHPEYESNGLFYVNYTANDSVLGLVTRISEFGTTDADTADVASERILLQIDQPFTNHNGGWIGFGPDNLLYIAVGDGGSARDPQDNSRRLDRILGKMLRIDPAQDGANPYTVPADNPFVGTAGAVPEIWHYGLRNPYRNSFDRQTGDLWMADVGQSAREEINWQLAGQGGQHYGWRCREGNIATPGVPFCSNNPLWVDPFFEYDRSQGDCSVTGGYIYRGCAIPDLAGQYIFSDYCGGRIWALDPDTGIRTTLLNAGFGVVSFGEDADGELYYTKLGGGIHKILPTSFVDDNMNNIPDTCEPCPADVNADGQATAADFTKWLEIFNNQC